jgi:L-threonylcarbamoyladenylate synthase
MRKGFFMGFDPQLTDIIDRAVAKWRSGGLVVMPTETVYGLGADACSGAAVAQIYALKNRPQFNPLIIHVATQDQAQRYAMFNDTARAVARAFWPGPLTLILPARPASGIDPLASAGLSSIAIRIPSHPVARALLMRFDGPIAAPSANISGQLSTTTPEQVYQSFGHAVGGQQGPLIVPYGAAQIGLESTILDLTVDPAVILRPGAVLPEDLIGVLGYAPPFATDLSGAPKAPGQLLKHYAPRHKLRLGAVDVVANEALLAFGSTRFMGLRGGGGLDQLPDGWVLNLSPQGGLTEAAAHLFTYLHQLDALPCQAIAVMDIPKIGLGVAIHDRLQRAALT